jgi:hypothetical protein
MRLAGGRSIVAVARTGRTLREKLYTLCGTAAVQDTVASNTELAVSSHVQDHGLANIGSEQHAPRDAVFRDHGYQVRACSGPRGANAYHKSAARFIHERQQLECESARGHGRVVGNGACTWRGLRTPTLIQLTTTVLPLRLAVRLLL